MSRVLSDKVRIISLWPSCTGSEVTNGKQGFSLGRSTECGETNLDLSKRRSAAVADALVMQFHKGINRFLAVGFGSSHPVETNDTLEDPHSIAASNSCANDDQNDSLWFERVRAGMRRACGSAPEYPRYVTLFRGRRRSFFVAFHLFGSWSPASSGFHSTV